ncbi:MAG: hypothetical protein FWG83_03620 [Oscillospiraceae bacterium]|nr:hypothetical protein [Oscillospiraceae bacterium]
MKEVLELANFEVLNQAATNPAVGVDLWSAIIPAGVAFVVLIVLFALGKKKKK